MVDSARPSAVVSGVSVCAQLCRSQTVEGSNNKRSSIPSIHVQLSPRRRCEQPYDRPNACKYPNNKIRKIYNAHERGRHPDEQQQQHKDGGAAGTDPDD